MLRRILVTVALLFLISSANSFAQDDELAAMYRKGHELIKPFLILANAPAANAGTPEARAQINQGIALLTSVTEARPDNWGAFWLIGKGHQALREHAAAYAAFKRSAAINPGHRDIAREYMIESICIGRPGEAVTVAQAAVDAFPYDAGLNANLGLAYLANSQLPQAKSATERALSLAPDDRITQRLLSEVVAVQNGKKPAKYCPS